MSVMQTTLLVWKRKILLPRLVLLGERPLIRLSGDTMFLIAKNLGTTLASLEAANEGVDPLILAAGQVLAVPVC